MKYHRIQTRRGKCRPAIAVFVVALVGGCSLESGTAEQRAPGPKNDWRAHQDAGEAAYARGDHPTAEAELRTAIGIAAPVEGMALGAAVSKNALAVVLINDGRLAEAGPLIDDAIRMLGDREQTATANQTGGIEPALFAAALTNRGHLELLAGRPVDAERDYRRSLAIDANSQAIHDRAVRGVVKSLCAQGRDQEAMQMGAPLGLQCAQR
jgi:tetratricopeptide (TPR) repeat protein